MRAGGTTVLAAAAMLASCALPENVVVLLPDESGRVGSLVVSNADGATELTKPLAATSLQTGKPPGRPFLAEQQPVARVFAKPLEATPRSPSVFVLFFTPGSAALTPASQAALQAAVQAVHGENGPPDISVVAHTDAVALAGETAQLSAFRAQAVRDALVAAGIPAAAIEVADYGSASPLQSEPGAAPAQPAAEPSAGTPPPGPPPPNSPGPAGPGALGPAPGPIAQPQNVRVEVTVR